jgi:hypothetical protein
MAELAGWGSFYVIVGTAAGALIGLQFVVMTLLAQRPPERLSEGGPTFLTPTIVHFSCTLMLSAILQAPWRSIAAPAFCWSLIGVGGALEHAQTIANHESPRTTKLYDRTRENLSADETARIRI